MGKNRLGSEMVWRMSLLRQWGLCRDCCASRLQEFREMRAQMTCLQYL